MLLVVSNLPLAHPGVTKLDQLCLNNIPKLVKFRFMYQVFVPEHTPHNLMNKPKPCMEGPLVRHLVHQRLSLTDETFLFSVIKDPAVVPMILLRG